MHLENPQSQGKLGQLNIQNDGLIFSSFVMPISVIIHTKSEYPKDFEICISDIKSNEILCNQITSDKSDSLFTWDLQSKSNSYVEPGRYLVSLIDKSDMTMVDSVMCNVADTRDILDTVTMLKRDPFIVENYSQTHLWVYLDILEDIQKKILELLKNNSFEKPYDVAQVSALFIRGMASELQGNSQNCLLLEKITRFHKKNPISHEQISSSKLGLWLLYDFIVNQLADIEDKIRADAMTKCNVQNLTPKDKNQIVLALVLSIYRHCVLPRFPRNILGKGIENIAESITKSAIKYISKKHINKSISMCHNRNKDY
ncbi:hypothetical protein [Nitrosopumilus sp.]|uniref:hypothetical protein n=1 Tax=Nitrosopumilus sp. TaxID=2024843 RepID=UPI003B5AD448